MAHLEKVVGGLDRRRPEVRSEIRHLVCWHSSRPVRSKRSLNQRLRRGPLFQGHLLAAEASMSRPARDSARASTSSAALAWLRVSYIAAATASGGSASSGAKIQQNCSDAARPSL